MSEASRQRVRAALIIDAVSHDAREGLVLAADAGYGGVAFSTAHPELTPAALGVSARRHLKRVLEGHQLDVYSLRVPMGGQGIADETTLGERWEAVEAGANLAYALGAGCISVYAGNRANLASGTAIEAAKMLAELADRTGVDVVLSGDDPALLESLLERVNYPRLRADLHPARLIGGDVMEATELLAERVGQLTCADAVSPGAHARPVPLGQGAVPWGPLLSSLRDHGFRGPVVVNVQALSNRPQAARQAAELLAASFPLAAAADPNR